VSATGQYFEDSEVALIQKKLKSLGFRPGPVDGIYGSQTRAALNRFEAKRKLKRSRGNTLQWKSIQRLGVVC
jgi:peptidoglycan hydrolase-like protein with peptidoglycan-binding domain